MTRIGAGNPPAIGTLPHPPPADPRKAGLDARTTGMILLPVGLARIRRQAVFMYVLLLPALTPFVLLGTVMGLAWLEDHVLPQADPTATAPEAPRRPVPGAVAAAPGRRPPRLAAPGPRRPRVPQGMNL